MAASSEYASIGTLLKQLHDDGWYSVKKENEEVKNGESKVYQLVHKTKPGKITIVGKESQLLGSGARESILKQAGLIPVSARGGK